MPSILHNQVRDWMSLHQRVRNELGEKREVKKASASAQKCSSQLMFFANLRADNDNILVNFQFTPALLKTRSSKMLGGVEDFEILVLSPGNVNVQRCWLGRTELTLFETHATVRDPRVPKIVVS